MDVGGAITRTPGPAKSRNPHANKKPSCR